MKAVFWFAVLLLCGAMVVFGFENSLELSVTVFGTVYHGVKLKYIAFAALMLGVVFTGIVAILEGANTRLANRRLRREIARLESEFELPAYAARQYTHKTRSPGFASRGQRRLNQFPIATETCLRSLLARRSPTNGSNASISRSIRPR